MRAHVRSVSLVAITFGILAVWLAAPSAALAQINAPQYWDLIGTGTWSTAGDWTANSTGIGGTGTVPQSGNDAVFDGSSVNGSTIVQLSGSQVAAGLYFNNTGTTLLESSSSTPETLSIGNDGITVAYAAGPVTLGDPLGVNLMPISITGSQIWTNNDFSSALNVVSAISASVTSTLSFAGGGNTNISGAVSNGAGILALTMSGTGTTTLSGANSYTGVTTISGGILQFNNELSLYNDATASWTAANIVVASGGTFAVNVGGSGQFTTGDVTTLLANLDGSVTTGGLLAGSTIGFDTTNASGGTFTIANSIANTTGSGGGAVGVTKLGTNTLVLAGANTYTGPTTIGAGTLSLTGSLTGSSVATSGAGVFSEGSTGVVVGAASFTQGSSGTSTLAGANTYTGATTISFGTLSLTGSIGGGASGTAISSAATFTESSTGVIAGTSSLAVTAGTTTLAGANTYTGATTVSAAGTLSLTGSIGGGASGTAISSAGTFTESSAGAIAGTSSLSVTAGMTTLAGANTYTGVTTISGGTLQFTNESSLYNDTTASWTAANVIVNSGGTLAFNVGGTGQFTNGDVTTLLANLDGSVTTGGLLSGSAIGFDTTNASGGTFTIASAIANTTGTGGGPIGLTTLGTNTLVLAGSNTYTGPTTISAGTLSLTGTLGSGGGTAISSSATFSESSTGVIAGTSSLTVNAGTTTLAGANTYTGATTINGGTLNLTGTIGGGASGTAITSAGTFTESSAGVIAGAATSSLTVIAGTTTLSGLNTYTGNTTVNGGTLALTPATTTPVINSSSKLMLGGGSLTMTGAAGVNASQTFNGTTLVSGSSSITAIDGGSGGNFELTLGTITRNASGGTVSFTLPAGTQSGTNGISTSTANNADGILGGYATVGGNWAVSTGGIISALSSYTGALPPAASGSATANYTLTGPQTQTVAASANSLNITDTVSGDTLTLGASVAENLTFSNGASGGLLYSGGGNYVINGIGTIGASSGEFIVTTTGSGTLTISAPVSTTATSFTKAGTGTLILAPPTGDLAATTITVAGGTLELANPTNYGTSNLEIAKSAVSVASGATFAPLAGIGTITSGPGLGANGASLTLNPGSTYSMVDGQIGAFDLKKGTGNQGTSTNLTLNNATLNFDIGVAGTDLLFTNSTASISGINTINLTPFGGILPVSGGVQYATSEGNAFSIIQANNGFTGAGTFQFSNGKQTENMTVGGITYTLALSQVALTSVDSTAAAETVTVTSQAPTLTWTGAALNPSGVGNGTPTLWDTGTTVNWSSSPTSNVPATYSDGNAVVFGDFPGTGGNQYVNYRYITIQPAGVTPSAVSFTGSYANYQINAGSGPIMGATTTLTSNSAFGNVILNSNTYGGGTWIAAGGTLGLGSGGLTILTSTTTSGPMGTGAITSGPLGIGTINFVGGDLSNYSINNNPDSIILANNIVISANALVSVTGGGTITFDGTNLTNPATVTLANTPVLSVLGGKTIINDVITGNSGLTVENNSGSGQLVLNGANTYTGITTIFTSGNTGANSLLSVSSLGLGGSPSGIGKSSNAAANLVINDSTLQYIGSGGTTDRLFTISSSTSPNFATLDASGTGPIVWSNPGAIVLTAAGLSLVLTGTNTGANTLTPILTGTSPLTKSEAGTWVLAGANTSTGATTINGGILAVTGTGQLYANSGSNSSSVITVNSGGTLEVDRWDIGGLSGDLYAADMGSFGNLAGGKTQLVINGGTIMYTGSTNNPNPNVDTRGFTIGTSGATLDAATAGQTWYVNLATSGNNVIASTSGLLTLNGPGNGVLAGVIPSGTTGGLTMSGTGTWTLTGANLYTGPTSLSSGTLVMGSTTALSPTSAVTLNTANNGLQFASGVVSATLGSLAGGGNIVLQNNAGSPAAVALTVGGNNGTTNYSGSLSGPGSLAMAGTGVFTLSGTSSYTGATSVNTSASGTLQLASTASLGNTAISVASGHTFAPLAGSGTITAGSIGAPGAGASLSLASGAIFNMEDGAVGTFQLQQGSGFGPNALTLGGATLDFDLNGSVGALEVPAVDLLAAGGTASVSGANTINVKLITPTLLNSGGPIPLITASSGLNIGGTFQLSPTSANMTVGGIPYALTLNTTPTALTLTIVSTAATLTWTGAAGSGGAASWDVGMSSNWADSTPMATTYATGDTAVFNDTNAISGLPITNSNIVVQAGGVTPTAVVFNNSAVNYTISDASGPIAGAATLSKSGTGLLSIQNSNNTYARGTTLSDGTLQIIASTTTGGGAITQGPLGTGTLTLSGGTFDNGNSNTITLANSVAITANTSFTGSGGGAFILDGTSLATPATVVLSNNPTLTVNNTTTINDVISGSAQSLTLAGSGTLILGGANTYPGVTTISSGTLQLGNGTANGSVAGSITDDSALVFLTTGTPSYATAISGSGSVTVNGTGAGALTLSGGNSFQGGLTILGNSVVTLSGANSYSGGTLIQSGTLRAGATNTLPTAGSVTFGGTASATGTLDLNGYGLTVGGLFVAPAAASNAANQIITNSNASGHGSTATLTYSGAGSNSFAGTLQNGSVSNLLALTVTSGNLTLSGTNTYTGATAVNGGTLQVASPGSLASAVTVSSPATLSGSGAIGGLVTVNSGGVLAPSGVASAATTMTLTGGLTLANGAVLDFNLGIPGSGDSVNVTGGALSLGTTGGTLNINEFGGGGELEATSYPLIFDSSITGNAALWNVGDHVGDTGHSYSFTDTGGQFDLVVSVSSSNATWISPSDSNYNNGPNWSSGTVPSGAGLIVTFGSGSQAMVSVNGSFIVGQLNFNNGGNSGAPTSYLLAGNGNLTLNNSGGGASVNVSSGSLTPSLGANVTLTLADSSLTTTFNIASGSSLVVGGAIGQSSSGQRVVLAGGGTLELESPNTYTGSTTINSGILQVDSGASIASTSVSIGAGGTLQLVGTTGALSSAANISTHGTGSAGDGALVLIGAATETVGTISGDTRQITDGSQQVTVYSGNTTVGDGNNSASLTATQILGNTLTINSNSTVTIAPSGSGIPTDAQGSDAASGAALAAGSSDSSSDSSGDPFSAIEAAIDSGAISNAKGQQLENRIAAIERLAATDPGLDVSLLEDRVLAALPSTSVWSSSGTSPLLDSGSGLLAVDTSTSGSSSDSSLGGATAFAPAAAFGGAPAAVPEPSTLLLAAMAGIGILMAFRRRII